MDITDVRANNIKAILNVLRFTQGLTKKEIAQKTGLSFSTVSNTCNCLKDNKILSEVKELSTGVGRLPNRFIFNSGSFCSICLDLQIKNILGFAILNFGNEILYQRSYDIGHCSTVEEIIIYAHNLLEEMSYYPQMKDISFVGIGIAVPGIYDKKRSILINCSLPFFNDSPIATISESIFHLPCYVDTESNFCAINMQQKIPDANNFIYLHLADEINAGVICQGNLVSGHNGHAVRISHLALGDKEKKCPIPGCGGFGCIETELSLHGMVGDYKNELPGSILQERWQQRIEEIEKKPEAYRTFIEEKGTYLGILLSVLVSIFDPAIVYLGGSASNLFNVLASVVMSKLMQRCPLAYSEGLQIEWDPKSTITLYEGINETIYEHWNPFNKVQDNSIKLLQ